MSTEFDEPNPFKNIQQDDLFDAERPQPSPLRFLRLLIPLAVGIPLGFTGGWLSLFIPYVIVGIIAASVAGGVAGGLTGSNLVLMGIRSRGVGLVVGGVIGLVIAHFFLAGQVWESVNHAARERIKDKIVNDDGSVEKVKDILDQAPKDAFDKIDKMLNSSDPAGPFHAVPASEKFQQNMKIRIEFGRGLTLQEAVLRPDWLYHYLVFLLKSQTKEGILLVIELIVILFAAAKTAQETITAETKPKESLSVIPPV